MTQPNSPRNHLKAIAAIWLFATLTAGALLFLMPDEVATGRSTGAGKRASAKTVNAGNTKDAMKAQVILERSRKLMENAKYQEALKSLKDVDAKGPVGDEARKLKSEIERRSAEYRKTVEAIKIAKKEQDWAMLRTEIKWLRTMAPVSKELADLERRADNEISAAQVLNEVDLLLKAGANQDAIAMLDAEIARNPIKSLRNRRQSIRVK